MVENWSVSDSLKLYNIENWGSQYFSISPAGNVTVHPRQGLGPGIDMTQLIQDAAERSLGLPVLFRFQDIIRHRVVALNETFRRIIREANYKGRYQGVYPIKVNQMREVVEEILDAGEAYDFGLEAGSKAELAAVVSMDISSNALLICNGYKDPDFVRMALMGVKLGKRVIIVVEKLTELQTVLSISKEMGVKPEIGIRARLYAKGRGKWESSGGETAKFGLTTPELLHAVTMLREQGLEDCFKLLHFHIGSQVSNIKAVKDAVREITRIYSKLVGMGLKIEFIDAGGGLGVDYDGSRSDFDSSINYSLQEYVESIVYTIQEICAAEDVPEPSIVTESGRALVAYHSVLVVNVFGTIEAGATPVELTETSDEADVVKELRDISKNLSRKRLLQDYHDALERKEQAESMFDVGILSLQDRAKVESLFWSICKQIRTHSKGLKYVSEEISEVNRKLADQYLCNFSVFQSMLDNWAIKQLFPIIPLHRHDEAPSREAILVDITCDSDGKVSKFIDLADVKDTLAVHELKPGEPYYFGFFLMGAYQDIMGDLHNLFGRVNEMHVFLDESEPGGYYIEEVIRGHSVSDLLSWTAYSAPFLEKGVKNQIDSQVREGAIKPREGVELQNFYHRVLNGYTYMDLGPAMVARRETTLGDTQQSPFPLQ